MSNPIPNEVTLPPSDQRVAHVVVQAGFAWDYAQPWLAQAENTFAPGRVYLGRMDDDLLVHAALHDAHVIRKEFPWNYPAFTKCDAFEMFLGPLDESTYYELHVTPSNSVLQLRFADAQKRALEERMVAAPLFSSRTWITAEGWNVLARIPLKGLFPDAFSTWCLSFGRYDYTPGVKAPVISTTSPHTICSFHCKAEWRATALAEIPIVEP